MSTLTAAELGSFSEFVYKNAALAASYPAQLPPGFVRISVDVDPATSNGFYAAAFRNADTGQIVIAYRGSDDYQDWAKNNLPTVLGGQIPRQFDLARLFVEQVKTRLTNDGI